MTSIYTLIGTKAILGKKKGIYKKKGTTKKYCKCKGKMMNIVKYKKSKNIIKKKKGGSDSPPIDEMYAPVDSNYNLHLNGGAKKRKKRKTRKTRK